MTTMMLLIFIAVVVGSIIAAIVSIYALIQGIIRHNTTVIALSGVGLGLLLIGIFTIPLLFCTAGLFCGLMAFSMLKKQPRMTYEEFKRQKTLMNDSDYVEYLALMGKMPVTESDAISANRDDAVRGVVVDSDVTLSAEEISCLSLKAKHGGLTPEEQQLYFRYINSHNMLDSIPTQAPRTRDTTSRVVLFVVIGFIVFCAIALLVAISSGMFSHLSMPGGSNKQTIHDLGNGTILLLRQIFC